MNKLLIIPLVLAVLLFGCAQKSETKIESIEDCQCHTQPWEYEDHVKGVDYCLDCHKIEEHPTGNWSKGKSIEDCSVCHETRLLRIHMPKTTCVDCHGDAKTIHEKFEKKFLEGEK
ncbi:hypothetical protein DRO97_04020 [Archaeoglobales archaeon]|nr:MAG: hypothetical protein DRO97_04020 [Archaeoglobales archaeon]